MFAVVLILAGCDPLLNQDGSEELAMYLADAPVNNVSNVYVTLERVEVHNDYPP
ncbi:MAG: hypothetical protein ACOCQN_00445 [Halanaerobiaceae bacterium]